MKLNIFLNCFFQAKIFKTAIAVPMLDLGILLLK